MREGVSDVAAFLCRLDELDRGDDEEGEEDRQCGGEKREIHPRQREVHTARGKKHRRRNCAHDDGRKRVEVPDEGCNEKCQHGSGHDRVPQRVRVEEVVLEDHVRNRGVGADVGVALGERGDPDIDGARCGEADEDHRTGDRLAKPLAGFGDAVVDVYGAREVCRDLLYESLVVAAQVVGDVLLLEDPLEVGDDGALGVALEEVTHRVKEGRSYLHVLVHLRRVSSGEDVLSDALRVIVGLQGVELPVVVVEVARVGHHAHVLDEARFELLVDDQAIVGLVTVGVVEAAVRPVDENLPVFGEGDGDIGDRAVGQLGLLEYDALGRRDHPGIAEHIEDGREGQLRVILPLVLDEEIDAAAHAVGVDLDVHESRARRMFGDGENRRADAAGPLEGFAGGTVVRHIDGEILPEVLLRPVAHHGVRLIEHVHGEIGAAVQVRRVSHELIVVPRDVADPLEEQAAAFAGEGGEVLNEGLGILDVDLSLREGGEQIGDVPANLGELLIDELGDFLVEDRRVHAEGAFLDVLDIEGDRPRLELPQQDEPAGDDVAAPRPHTDVDDGLIADVEEENLIILLDRFLYVQKRVIDAVLGRLEERREVQCGKRGRHQQGHQHVQDHRLFHAPHYSEN